MLSHVLEHVREAEPAIDGLAATTREGARVYAEVPNAAEYTEYLVAPFLDFNTEHINHFSVTTLQRLFASRGWKIVASGTKTIRRRPRRGTRRRGSWPQRAAPGEIIDEVPADRLLRQALSRYVSASQSLLARVIARCEELGVASKEIIVWGTGQTTAILLAETPLGGARIPRVHRFEPMHYGRTISGAPVVPPDALRTMPAIPIVVGSLLHGGEIAAAIAARGLTNPVIRLDPGSHSGTT